MFSSERFPERFAMLRTQGDNGPYLQVLQAENMDENSNLIPICFIQNVIVNPNTSFQVDRIEIPNRNIYQVYSLSYGARTDEHFYYWYLPYELIINGERIPILDFQYKAWLPIARTCILYLRTMGDNLIHAANEIAMERCERIHAASAERTLPTPRTPPRTPPARISRNEAMRAVAAPRTPPSQYRPLPSNVGNILMRNARVSTDSCPISYTEYSDAERLSITSCFHIFETRALERWMDTGHETCPVCRESIQNIVVEEVHN